MSTNHAIDFYELLPALYRQRDGARGYPLRALLEIIARQADLLKENIDGLWDDFFIETCAEWVIPYIGELVGNNPLHGIERGIRADVAKTIYYRRRKGTQPMLEELARDITGWGSHVAVGFEQLGWTQNLNHLRYQAAPVLWDAYFVQICAAAEPNPIAVKAHDPIAKDRVGTVNLRNPETLDRIGGPFDRISRSLDLRPPGPHVARYNLGHIVFFLWRLNSYPLQGVEARRAARVPNGFHFSPLGHPAPLFHHPQREAGESELAGEGHVAAPIRPLAFHLRRSDYYGADRSLAIYLGPERDLVPAEQLLCRDLGAWAEPPAGKVAVDVVRGRIVFPADEAPERVTVSYTCGFSAPIGGGPYARRESLAELDGDPWTAGVSSREKDHYRRLANAVASCCGVGRRAIVTIADSATYHESFSIDLIMASRLVIQAEDGQRPTLRVSNALVVKGPGSGSSLTLNGLLIEGRLEIQGELDELNLLHCTLVPGCALTEDGDPAYPELPSLSTTPYSVGPKRVNIRHSIVGALQLPANTSLTIQDSIVQAPTPMPPAVREGIATETPALPVIAGVGTRLGAVLFGPSCALERVTVFGNVHAREVVLATEVIFMGRVITQRSQTGGLRFSYLDDPNHSQTPRRYRCQPELAWERRARELGLTTVASLSQAERDKVLDRLRPLFTSTRYGDPGYAQLTPSTAPEIFKGAEEGAEMGVYHHLKQPQRETNLRIRLQEYLPFGLEAGVVYVT